MKRGILNFLILVFTLHPLLGSIKNSGFSSIQNYTRDSYSAGTQIWSICQDNEGMMYFGNNSGLLAYDGTYWTLFPVPNGSIIRSVKIDGDKIFVGASGEFGYFIPDLNHGLVYVSLINKVPEAYRDFGEVWHIFEYQGGILFHSFNAIFVYRNDTINVLVSDRNLHFSFKVDSTIYIREINRGLQQLHGSELQFVKGTEKLGNLTVMNMIRYDERSILVVTREQGLFILDEKGLREYKCDLQKHFKENQIFSAIALGEGNFAFGTVQDGVIIMDHNGKLVQHLNRERGLQNNTVLSLFSDRDKNLWLGLDNGIDMIILNSPLSYLAHQNDIGATYAIEKKDDYLYLGTNQGLFYTKWPVALGLNGKSTALHFIEGSQGQVWTLSNKRDIILMGHDKGTFIVDRDKLNRISSVDGGWTFIEVPGHPELLMEGMYFGLQLNRYDPKQHTWKSVKTIPGFNQSCKEIYFDEKGNLWMGHGYKGIYRIQFNEDFDSIIHVKHYSKSSGLPSDFNLNILKFNNHVIVSSDQGIFRYDYSRDIFYPDENLTKLFDNKNVFSLVEDQQGDLWYFTLHGMGILKSNFDGTYTKTELPFLSLGSKLIASYESIYSIDRANILIPNLDGVIHFDPTFNKDYNSGYAVKISKVISLPDSVLFAESFNNSEPLTNCVISYRYNQLRFMYSALSYEMSKDIKYRIMLDGFDTDWSDWNSGTEKEYTNLHEGDYTFKVQARNIYGKISEAIPFHFQILPPFYRSTAAYILYALLIASGIAFSVFLVLKKIEKEKHKLKEKQRLVMREKEKVFEEASIKAEQEIIKLRNEKLEAENQMNLAELESKNKELASITMQITYKNELLNRVKQKLTRVSEKMLHLELKRQIIELIKTLEKDLSGHDDWERFEVHFDQVHEDFLKKLRKNYPELTPKDLRLAAYLKMNLSSKEIAPLLNISVRGVEISRYRLRKKMSLPREANLTEFMMNM